MIAETIDYYWPIVFVTTGRYDIVATLDMPNAEAMVKFVSSIMASGNARTTTVRAFPVEKFAKLAAEAPWLPPV
jgi:uncharacterized protein with GYD domain